MKTVIGIDLGGTNVRVAKITEQGEVLQEIKSPSYGMEGPEKVTSNIPGFKEPLIRNINVNDVASAEKFINRINENEDKKEYLTKLYDLSDYRNTTICASNQERLDKIINE